MLISYRMRLRSSMANEHGDRSAMTNGVLGVLENIRDSDQQSV